MAMRSALVYCCYLLSLIVLLEASSIRELEPATEETAEEELEGFKDFDCPQQFGLFSHPRTCKGFFQCHNGFSGYHNCPATLLFNPVTKQCDYAAKTPCYQRKARTYFIHKQMKWWEGAKFCKTINQRLVAINGRGENDFLKNITKLYGEKFDSEGSYWTSGLRTSVAPPAYRGFKWYSWDRNFCNNNKNRECDQGYKNWCDGKRLDGKDMEVECLPDDMERRCLQVSNGFEGKWWAPDYCKNEKNVICESVISPNPTTPTASPTTATTTTAAPTTAAPTTATRDECDITQHQISHCDLHIDGSTIHIDHTIILNDVQIECSTGEESCINLAADCTFLMDTGSITGNGGARFIYMEKGAKLVLEDVEISSLGNAGLKEGGGVISALHGGNMVKLEDVIAKDNHAGFGGFLDMKDGILNAEECEFVGNAANYAGVMRVDNSNVRVAHTLFEDNTAQNVAGAIQELGSVIDFKATNFTNNHALHGGGGAVRLDGAGSVKFTDHCHFVNNDAQSKKEGSCISCWAKSENSVDVSLADDTELTPPEHAVYNDGGLCKIHP